MSLSDYSLEFLDRLTLPISEKDVEKVWKDRFFPLVLTDDFKENWMAIPDPNALFIDSGTRCRVEPRPQFQKQLEVKIKDEDGSRIETISYEAIVFAKFAYQKFCDETTSKLGEPTGVERRRFINTMVSKLPKKWQEVIVYCDLRFYERPLQKSPSVDSHVYQPLTNPTNIRLLKVQPCIHSYEKIYCSLVEAELPSAVDFEALSYVWGKRGSEESIVLDGKVFPITKNLDQALRRLRPRSHHPRILWVDAVCIDQSNHQERTEQVAQMDSVYSHASGVLVWLGEESHTSATLFENFDSSKKLLEPDVLSLSDYLLESPFRPFGDILATVPDSQLKAQGLNSEGKRSLQTIPPESNKNQMISDGKLELFTAFCNLLRRPWWRRVWVLQELTLAKKATLQCGPKSMDWSLFQIFLFSFLRFSRSSMPTDRLQECSASGELSHLVASISPFFFLQKASRYVEDVPRVSMANLLTLTSKFEATDSRDRLFALVGILPPDSIDRQGLKPDYGVNMKRMCIQTAKHFIRTTGTLDVLVARPQPPYYFGYAFGGQQFNKLLAIPSWVPNWNESHFWPWSSIWIGAFSPVKTLELYMQASRRKTTDGASYSTSNEIPPNDTSERLQVYNASSTFNHHLVPTFSQFDEILTLQGTTVDVITEVGGVWDPLLIGVIHQDASDYEKQREGEDQLRRRVVNGWKEIARLQEAGDYPFVNDQSRHEAFWRTLMLDRYHCDTPEGEPITVHRIGRGKDNRLAAQLKSKGFPSDLPPNTAEEEAAMLDYIFMESNMLQATVSLLLHCINLVFFTTTKGYFGVGHPNLRSGDKVVVLLTAPIPLVIREHPEGHTLVGECYVHGVMDGEAMFEEGEEGELRRRENFDSFDLL